MVQSKSILKDGGKTGKGGRGGGKAVKSKSGSFIILNQTRNDYYIKIH